MTEIEQKVQLVRKYIYELKGIDINNINLVYGKDLAKLDYAYKYALNYFKQF